MRRDSPCCLASLRTKKALPSNPAPRAAQATGSAPIVIPPTAVAPQGARVAGDELAEGGETRREQDRPLGVDVVLGHLPAGQRHLTKNQCVGVQFVYQPLRGVHFRIT